MDGFSLRVTELARISRITKGAVTQALKKMPDEYVDRRHNRVIGVSGEAAERVLRSRGFGSVYDSPAAFLTQCICGGVGKTTSTAGLAQAWRRISSQKNPIVVIDCDSQSSLSKLISGRAAKDDEPILLSLIEKKCKLGDVLTDLGENMFLVRSNLNNIYLDKVLNSPKGIATTGTAIFTQILQTFGSTVKIFIDTPPALAPVTQTFIAGMAHLAESIESHVVVPIRMDDFGKQGAKFAINETIEALEAFRFDPKIIELTCYLCGFDQRLKTSVEVLKEIMEDSTLRAYLSPISIRYSSEVGRGIQKKSKFGVFENYRGAITVGADYTDLLMSLLGMGGK